MPLDERTSQQLQEIIIDGTKDGLGMRIVGGRNKASNHDSEFGIFVKEVIRGSLASRDGNFDNYKYFWLMSSSDYTQRVVNLVSGPVH